MKILFVHNYYQQAGGEDAGVLQERDLLAAFGHRVIEYVRHSNEIMLNGLPSRIRLGARTLWSRRTYRELRLLLTQERPDVAHIHNIVPLISPSAYYACAEAGVPMVQTLHNYRLVCPAGSLLRKGHICEECMDHTLFRSVRHRCYKGSASASGIVALMIESQRWLGTWSEKLNCYIARTEFARRKFIEGGLPAERIIVKPCFVHPDPGGRDGRGEFALFAGRLSQEKGLQTLLKAWAIVGESVPLRIAGDGPLRSELEDYAKRRAIRGVTFLGRLESQQVLAEMKRARFLVFPSEWFEGLPLTIVEAFACGVPVIASGIGSMLEIVKNGHTGLHFTPGDDIDLAAKVRLAWQRSEETETMGSNARAEFEAKYTPERNYKLLTQIHETVLAACGDAPSSTPLMNAVLDRRHK